MPSLLLQPDATDGLDNNLYYQSGLGQDNFGITTEVNVGYTTGLSSTPARGIFKFDISSIPNNARISSAIFSLYDYDNAFRTVNGFTVDVYHINNQNGNWVEGTANGSPVIGASCYLFKAYNTVVWKDANGAGDYPGLGAPGQGYGATIIATASIPDGSTGFRDFNFTGGGTTILQSIVEGSQVNNGFLIRGADETASGQYVGFRSSDWTTAGERPKFLISYTLGGDENNLLLLLNGGSG